MCYMFNCVHWYMSSHAIVWLVVGERDKGLYVVVVVMMMVVATDGITKYIIVVDVNVYKL